jgi:glycosyltransferase involved in cell wall biosynthesis
MKITVVIPVKDEEQVFEALPSATDQTLDPHEILVIDDYSTAEYAERLQEFCHRHDGVAYVDKSAHPDYAKGLNGSRNLAIDQADGDAIALLDGDCVADEDWIKHLAGVLEDTDVVESHVQYVNEGKNCPMDRVIQNTGEQYKFLGAGLAFRLAVADDVRFEERFTVFRGDTTFGLQALDAGYSYGFADDAVLRHHSGRFTPYSFLKERLRFVEDALFVDTCTDADRFDDEVPHVGPVLYPTELAFIATLVAAAVLPFNYITVPVLLLISEALYLRRENAKRDLDFCMESLLMLFALVPLALFVKRYAIWRGAVKYKVPVV